MGMGGCSCGEDFPDHNPSKAKFRDSRWREADAAMWTRRGGGRGGAGGVEKGCVAEDVGVGARRVDEQVRTWMRSTRRKELAELEITGQREAHSRALTADLPAAIALVTSIAGWADRFRGKTIPVQGRYLHTRKLKPGAWGSEYSLEFYRLLIAAWKLGAGAGGGLQSVLIKPAETALP